MEERWILPKSIGQHIHTPGCDFGPKGIVFEYRFMNCIIAKWGGHRCFLSRGAQEYHPTLWIVAQVLGAASSRGDSKLPRGVSVKQLCTIRVAPDRSASFQRAIKVCHHPEEATYWKDRCEHCKKYRGEHKYGTECLRSETTFKEVI